MKNVKLHIFAVLGILIILCTILCIVKAFVPFPLWVVFLPFIVPISIAVSSYVLFVFFAIVLFAVSSIFERIGLR